MTLRKYILQNGLEIGMLKFNDISKYVLFTNFIIMEMEILNQLLDDESNGIGDENFIQDVTNSASIMYEFCNDKEHSYFTYIKDNNNKILMSMVVYYDPNHKDITYKKYNFQYHIGIHRNLEDIINNEKIEYKGISMLLHWGACILIRDIFGISSNRIVLINPLNVMHNILNSFATSNNINLLDVETEYSNSGNGNHKIKINDYNIIFLIDENNKCIPGASVGFIANELINKFYMI